MSMAIRKIVLLLCAVLISFVAQAQSKVVINDWQIQSTNSSIEAYTVGGPNLSFGLYCAAHQCMFYLHDSLLCRPGSKSPVLMSGINATASINLQCANINGVLFQILEPFNAVLNVIKVGGFVSFAVPIQNGSFGVSRFSLNGAPEAIKQALEEASRSKQQGIPKEAPAQPIPGTRRPQDISI